MSESKGVYECDWCGATISPGCKGESATPSARGWLTTVRDSGKEYEDFFHYCAVCYGTFGEAMKRALASVIRDRPPRRGFTERMHYYEIMADMAANAVLEDDEIERMVDRLHRRRRKQARARRPSTKGGAKKPD